MTFKKGESGNVLGRPQGSRRRLGEAFLKDMHADWEAHGARTISAFRKKRPSEYVKVVAALLPKQLDVKVSEYAELTDEQLQQQLDAVCAELERIEQAERRARDAAAQPIMLPPFLN